MKPKSDIFTTKVLAYTAVMITSGSISSIAFQIQKHYNFKHVITLCQQMFLGEILSLLTLVVPLMTSQKKEIVYFLSFRNEYSIVKASRNPNLLIVGFGGLLDALASCLELLAILAIPSNYYAMMKNGAILFTAIFTILILKKTLFRHHWLGIAVILLGFSVITCGELWNAPQAKLAREDQSTYLGVLMMMLSLIFSGLQAVYQEYLFQNFALDPKRVVGSEGILGTILVSVVLLITSHFECQFDDFCERGKPFDSPAFAILDLVHKPQILVAALIAIFSIMILNISGTSLTKMVSAIFRKMLDSLRTVLIWIIACLLGLDKIDIWSFIVEFIGFVFLLLGNLIYNEIIEISFLGFNKYVKNKSNEF